MVTRLSTAALVGLMAERPNVRRKGSVHHGPREYLGRHTGIATSSSLECFNR